jgi:hypothetical protein
VLKVLPIPPQKVHRLATEVLRVLFEGDSCDCLNIYLLKSTVENLREPILVERLLLLLNSRKAGDVFVSSPAL